ncbi:class I SAM-dependent methyltransferase [Labrenzia sp. ac12]
MSGNAKHDSWSAGRSYDHYMGRWSRLIAREFVSWLNAPPDADWADIGCGTGALTETILDMAKPKSVVGLDLSEGFVMHARDAITDERARFEVGSAQDLPLPDNSVDVSTSALALNFVPDKLQALAELRRITRPGGTISFYVWDYPGGGMGFIDAFWKAATSIDPAAEDLDEALRFPFCTPDGLRQLCTEARLPGANVHTLEVDTVFPGFEEFWHPFTLGAGPAPGYCMNLPREKRDELKAKLQGQLDTGGEIRLPARAFAVRYQQP